MRLRTIRSQIVQLKAKLPPPRGKDPVFFLVSKSTDPDALECDDGAFRYRFYRSVGELRELRAGFDRDFGPATRGLNDPPCLFIHFSEAADFLEGGVA